MITMVFTWSRRRRSFVSNLCLIYLVSLVLCVYDIWYLWYDLSYASRGALAWLYICNRAKVYKSSSRIQIRVFLLLLQVIFESLYLSTSLIGRARYTNPRVPEGHTLVTRWVIKLVYSPFRAPLVKKMWCMGSNMTKKSALGLWESCLRT
jgi:hypothetical protein